MLSLFQAHDPKLFYAIVAGLTWLLIYLWRKFSLGTWDALTKGRPFVEHMPALILSGLISLAPALDKGFWPALENLIYGIVFGGGAAVFGHRFLKDSPLPYTGGTPPPKPPMFTGSGKVATEASEANTPKSGRMP